MIIVKGYIERDYFSRYVKSRMLDNSAQFYLEYFSKLDLRGITYLEHTITDRDYNKLTCIANKYYKNPLYWWMIAIMNGIYNALETPKVGSVIKIPYRDEVIRLFNSEHIKTVTRNSKAISDEEVQIRRLEAERVKSLRKYLITKKGGNGGWLSGFDGSYSKSLGDSNE